MIRPSRATGTRIQAVEGVKVRNHLVGCLIIKNSTADLAAFLQSASDIELTMITHFRARTAAQPQAWRGEACDSPTRCPGKGAGTDHAPAAVPVEPPRA